MRWLGAVLSIVVLGGASTAFASDDVCSIGTRLMSVAQGPQRASLGSLGFSGPGDDDISLDENEAQLAAEALQAWALGSAMDVTPTTVGNARDDGLPARSVLMCVGTDPSRCLPAAPPPVSVRFEIARSPRAQSASGWDDVAPPGWTRITFVVTAEPTGPCGVRTRLDRPPRLDARA